MNQSLLSLVGKRSVVIVFIVYAIIPERMIDAVKNWREVCEIFTLTKDGHYLVSEHHSFGNELRGILQYQEQYKRYPGVLGPNGLGMLPKEMELNTVLIRETWPKVRWDKQNNLAEWFDEL